MLNNQYYINILLYIEHCEWDNWKIGKCSKKCGGGTQTCTRNKKKKAKHGGDKCTGSARITRSCNTHECPGKNTPYFELKQYNILIMWCKLNNPYSC